MTQRTHSIHARKRQTAMADSDEAVARPEGEALRRVKQRVHHQRQSHKFQQRRRIIQSIILGAVAAVITFVALLIIGWNSIDQFLS